MSYFYILLTVLLTVYGQIVIKWEVLKIGALPQVGKLAFIISLLTNLWIVSALLAAFMASVTWMMAVSKLQLSVAYPFTSIAFVLILLSSSLIFHEAITPFKIIGVALIVIGVVIAAQT
jgi:multidrug transporter EmrE-like cation transporter